MFPTIDLAKLYPEKGVHNVSAWSVLGSRMLFNLRHAGTGPEYVVIRSRIFYRGEAIERWLAESTHGGSQGEGVA